MTFRLLHFLDSSLGVAVTQTYQNLFFTLANADIPKNVKNVILANYDTILQFELNFISEYIYEFRFLCLFHLLVQKYFDHAQIFLTVFNIF